MIENPVISFDDDDEFDFGELFFALKKGLLAIILCIFVGAAAYSYTAFCIQPLYTSSSMIYFFSKTTTVTWPAWKSNSK